MRHVQNVLQICPIVTRQWINNAKSVQAVKKCTSSAKNQAIKILQVNHVIQTNQSKLKTHTWVKSNEINHINETNQPMGQLVDQSTHPSNKSIKRKSTTQSTTIHWFNDRTNRSVTPHSLTHFSTHSINQSIIHSINQAIKQASKQSATQSVNQPHMGSSCRLLPTSSHLLYFLKLCRTAPRTVRRQ